LSGEPDPRLKVVLCWHMHQPQYRDLLSRRQLRPWAYLHGIKDYVDMAVHLESVPEACAVVNFSPVLLEQLDEYSSQLAAHLRNGAPLGDPVLALLTPQGVPGDRAAWPDLIRSCLRGHKENLIGRFEPYRDLAKLAGGLLESGSLGNASPQMLTDLAAWFHLAWFGETVHRGDPRVQALVRRSGHFSAEDLRTLLECVADVLAGLVPRYRRLAGNGKVELSVSPWGHPILPLLFEFADAREADPEIELPTTPRYPGGADRARWHLARAVQAFSRSFGVRPQGCWPPEGAASTASMNLLQSFGFDWVASGESVLRRSLQRAQPGEAPARDELSSGYRLEAGRAVCFFCDDELSDLIGFNYSKWHGDDAAADFVGRLDRIAAGQEDNSQRVVSIVVDGANAWEYYPFNGYYFLRALYQRLAAHPRLQLTTFSGCLRDGVAVRPLERLVAGSWIQGSLSSWVGSPSRNRAWDMLCDAKSVFDQVVVEGGLDEAGQLAAEEQLGACEGSDWFWWSPDQHTDDVEGRFDPLFRRHLLNLYTLLGEAPPSALVELAVTKPLAAQAGHADSPGEDAP
jgi:alpha-amylase/alpha-mannosidase (GH57 family)